MANERLLAAMTRAGVTVRDLATLAERDPKTVSRWIGGRLPHPRQRFVVAKALAEDEEFLWPGLNRKPTTAAAATSEIIAAYPYRSNMSTASWWNLIVGARHQIDLLGYTLYFLALEHPALIPTLREKCANGCRVRVAIADPRSSHVLYRDEEEDQPITLVARIRTTLKAFAPVRDCEGLQMRYQDIPLYNSVFRFDDLMLVTPHLYATPGAAAPVLHLRRLGPNGLFSRFASHFEDVWPQTRDIPSMDWPS
jgi:lambda repressor-like predicted transcriptional regulator